MFYQKPIETVVFAEVHKYLTWNGVTGSSTWVDTRGGELSKKMLFQICESCLFIHLRHPGRSCSIMFFLSGGFYVSLARWISWCFWICFLYPSAFFSEVLIPNYSPSPTNVRFLPPHLVVHPTNRKWVSSPWLFSWDKWGQCPPKKLGWTNPLTKWDEPPSSH